MNRTRIVVLTLAFCCTALLAWAASVVQVFTANYQGTDVKLEWRLTDEQGVESFELARKRPEEAVFTRITSMTANGTSNYTFVDDQLYKTGQTNTVSYRLTMKSAAGITTYYTSISHNPTAVQRTWGSIKSMFK